MAKRPYTASKVKSSNGSPRNSITGRFVTSKRAPRRVSDEGIARLRARGASEEFLRAARGKS